MGSKESGADGRWWLLVGSLGLQEGSDQGLPRL